MPYDLYGEEAQAGGWLAAARSRMRNDMPQQAQRPNWGDTRWAGPGGYIPLPAYDSNVGEFLARAITMGPLALRSSAGTRTGNDHVWAHQVSRIPEATPYMNPDMPGMQSVPPRVADAGTRAITARGVHLERDVNSLAARINAMPEPPDKLRMLAEIRDQASRATSGRMTSQHLEALQAAYERLVMETRVMEAVNTNTHPRADWRVISGGRND